MLNPLARQVLGETTTGSIYWRRNRRDNTLNRFRRTALRLVGFQIFDQQFQLHQLAGVTLRRLAELGALEARNLQLEFLDQKGEVYALALGHPVLLLDGELLLQLRDGGVTRDDEPF